MVICKDCGHLNKQSLRSIKGTRPRTRVLLTGLCGVKAITGRREFGEERDCDHFIPNIFCRDCNNLMWENRCGIKNRSTNIIVGRYCEDFAPPVPDLFK